MQSATTSLQQLFPRYYFIPAALVLSALFLACGLVLPVITLKELIFWKTTFSVLTGIQSLFDESHYFLALIILLFSVCFPLIKLTALIFLWFTPAPQQLRARTVEWLGIIGKWSMLDVFVVALMIVVTKISGLAKAEARGGIYFFGASIFLAMLATEKINALLKAKPKSV